LCYNKNNGVVFKISEKELKIKIIKEEKI